MEKLTGQDKDHEQKIVSRAAPASHTGPATGTAHHYLNEKGFPVTFFWYFFSSHFFSRLFVAYLIVLENLCTSYTT